MTDWIPVSERLPEVGKEIVFVYMAFNGTSNGGGWTPKNVLGVYSGRGMWKANLQADGYEVEYEIFGNTSVSRITHWMPLPPPPQEAAHD